MKRLVLVLAIGACGGGSPSHPDAHVSTPDAPPDATAPGPNEVTFRILGRTPKVVAYRDGHGPWQTPTATGTRDFVLHVTDTYEVAYACQTTDTDVEVFAGTFADGAKRYGFCFTAPATTPTTVTVTGQMQQPGSVYLYDQASGTTSPWTFSLDVGTGTQDLLAFGTDHRMAIRRGLTISAAQALPAIDLASEGAAMVPVDLTVHGTAASDTLTASTEIITDNGYGDVDAETTTLYAPPASLLVADDYLDVYVSTFGNGPFRSADVEYKGAPITFDLPPVLTGVTFGATGASLSATWSSLPAYTQAEVSAVGQSARFGIEATKAYLDATHATALALDALPPGFDAAWLPKLTDASTTKSFEITDQVGDITYHSGVSASTSVSSVARVAGSSRTRLRSLHRSTDR